MSESKINIPNFSYPFKQVNKEEEYYKLFTKIDNGNYLFSKDGFWHGGIHFSDTVLTEVKATQGIRAIADGELVAYRVNDKYLQNDDEEKDLEGLYSNGFFLIRHFFEYPEEKKLTFFSLYMHTASKDKYDFSTHKVIGTDRFLRIGTSYNEEDKLEELSENTKITLGEEVESNRYKVLYVDKTKRTDNTTIHKSNIKAIEDTLNLKTININTSTDTIIIPTTPIKIKAGEVIGLVGEYNRSKQINRELLHLEVFTKDDVKSFADTAKSTYVSDTSEDKPKPIKVIIENEKDLYAKICECKLDNNSNIRKGFSNDSSKYNNETTAKNTTLEVDLTTKQKVGNYTRVKVLKIDTADVSSDDYTVITNVLIDKKDVFKIISEKSTKKEILSKDIKIEKDSTNEKYLLYSDDSNKYIKYTDCEELHPITFDWATIVEESSDDDVSIFENLHKYLLPEQEEYLTEKLEINSIYKKLFELIDINNNSQLEAQELEDASKNETIKKTTSKYIVKHSSEWDKKINLPKKVKEILQKHKENIKNYADIIKHLDNEEKRVDKLAFFEECKGITDFPTSDKVFHFNPIGLVGEFGKSVGCLTMDKFVQIFPTAPEEKRKEVLEVFNNYCHAFEINTPLRVAHFFAQVKEEVGESINFKNESLNYSAKRLKTHKNTTIIDDDGRTKKGAPFSYFWNNHDEAELYGSIKIIGQTANQEAIANRVYANRNGNGNIASGDGWNFRGKGFIQLTGRANYENTNKELQIKVPNSNIDIIGNPESILTVEGAMTSSMAYWTINRLNTKADHAGWDREKVDSITDTVNSGTSSRENRKENFDLIQSILNN